MKDAVSRFQVRRLYVRPRNGSAGIARPDVTLVAHKGISGDYGFGASKNRQISLGWLEAFEKAAGTFREDRPLEEPDFADYRANILLSGAATDLLCHFNVTGSFLDEEGRPVADIVLSAPRTHCHRMDALGSPRANEFLDREFTGALARVEKVYGDGVLKPGHTLALQAGGKIFPSYSVRRKIKKFLF